MMLSLSVVLGLTWFPLAFADLPVHCLRNQIAGKWRFFLSAPTPLRSTCGHQTPDVDKLQPSFDDFSFDNAEFQVEVKEPNTATLLTNQHGSSLSLLQRKVVEESGHWTMIYDEGFNLRSPSYDFFSFNHFEIPENPSLHGKKFFRSFCGQTEVGWYKEVKTGHFGCYRAERVERKDTVFYHLSLLAQQKSNSQNFLASYDGMEENLSHEQRLRLSNQLGHEDIVAKINANKELGWTAAAYSNDFLAEKMWQLRRRAHRQVGRKSARSAPAQDERDLEDDLPTNFDWGNVNGESYLDQILDQSDCGSCYAVASIHMLGARYRVLKNDTNLLKPNGFSINFPLYCSDLNQGCAGGYPSLISMWSRDVGLVPHKCGGNYFTSPSATCASALPDDFSTCVQNAATRGQVAKVKNWNYIGGYYGACSASKMKTDLFTHGPVAVALEPGPDFMYYKSGIYKSVSLSVNVNWVKVDHAVLLIGWGEEDGKKFWTIQNSWGDSWGENGKIRIIRGENESGVEFQAVSATLEEGSADAIINYVNKATRV